MTHTSQFDRFKKMAQYRHIPIVLPLIAEENRPIVDAAGALVSIPQNAQAFADAMNLVHDINTWSVSLEDIRQRAEQIAAKVQS